MYNQNSNHQEIEDIFYNSISLEIKQKYTFNNVKVHIAYFNTCNRIMFASYESEEKALEVGIKIHLPSYICLLFSVEVVKNSASVLISV